MTRLERYNIFKEFFSNSKKMFKEIDTNYKQHTDLRQAYGFHIAPGSSIGGQDINVVEVFFGNRPYQTSKKIKDLKITTETEIAYGSKLHFFQVDTGYVFITMYPAYTKTHKPQEEFILWGVVKNPKKLMQINFITKLYKYLVSYLAVTSIDDKPKIVDRLKIFYLRMTRKYYTENVTKEARIKWFMGSAIKIILTVGLSGFLISFIPFFNNLNRNKEIEKQMNVLIERQNEIINVLNKINERPQVVDYTYQIEELKIELEKLNEQMKNTKGNEK
jgi:hypothetical protein